MMSRANDSAYPIAPVYSSDGSPMHQGDSGLTIREDFAKAAMVGLLSDKERTNALRAALKDRGFGNSELFDRVTSSIACLSVAMADALIAELAKVAP